MERQKKIVDASIVAKWFLNEEGSDKALGLREEHISGKAILIISDFTYLEVLNVLRYKKHTEQMLSKANSVLWDLQLHAVKTNQFLLDKASSLALKYNLSLYDALYVALATMYGVFLFTADKEIGKTPNTVII